MAILTTLRDSGDRAERAVAESPWTEGLARAGLLTRGMMHFVVGWLALRIATGESGRRADHKGAMTVIAGQPLGRLLVLALAIGFLAYAGWRLFEATLDPEDKGPLKRIGYAARGLLYLGFFAGAISFVARGSKGGGGSSKEQDLTAQVLGMGFGRPLVIAAGLGVIAMGVWNGWRAITRSFEKDLKRYEMSPGQCSLTVKLGVVGHLGRMAAYVLSGAFVVRAAVRFDPKTGVGLDAALHELSGRPHGTWLLALVAAGLTSFGIFQLLVARYRRVLGS